MPAKKKRAATAPSKKPAAKKPTRASGASTKKKATTKAAGAKATKAKGASARRPTAKPKPKAKAKAKAKPAPVATPKQRVVAPAPPPPAPPRPALPPDPTEELAQALAALSLAKKADDVLILRVTELTSYADFFVLASAPSERQVQAIARHVAEEMKRVGKPTFGTEGLEQGHWVLCDYGAVVLHVFLGSARHYYDLEGFWSDAPRVEVEEARGLTVLERLGARVDHVDELEPAFAANE